MKAWDPVAIGVREDPVVGAGCLRGQAVYCFFVCASPEGPAAVLSGNFL